MANDVSLAVTSAKLNLEGPPTELPTGLMMQLLRLPNDDLDGFASVSGPGVSSSGSIAMILGVVVLVLAMGIVAYSYK